MGWDDWLWPGMAVQGSGEPSRAVVPPAVRYGAWWAARASDAVVTAGQVDSFPPYVTKIGAVSALPSGAKTVLAADALLNNVVCAQFATAGAHYTLTTAPPAVMTVVGLWRWTASSHTLFAFTVGGAVNTGQAYFKQSGSITARALAGDATQADADAARSVVTCGVWNPGAKVENYLCSVAPVLSAANAGANAGNVMLLGAINSAGAFKIDALAEVCIFDKVLSVAEMDYTLGYYGWLGGVAVAGSSPFPP